MGGVGTVVTYPGPYGTVPQHDDPDIGQLFDHPDPVNGVRAADTWIELRHKDDEGDVTTYRRASIELGDPPTYEGGRKPAGLIAVGDVEHGISNEFGSFEKANVDIRLSDTIDRLVRGVMEDGDLEGDDIYVKSALTEARQTGKRPVVVMRGKVQKPPALTSPMKAGITAVDALFSDYGPLGPQRQWPPKIPPGCYPTSPPDSFELAMPWLYGMKSDEGATDPIFGTALSKGLCPLIYVGKENLGVTPVSGSTGPSSGNAPPSYPTFQMYPLGGDGNWVSTGSVADDPYHGIGRVDGGVLTMIDFGRASSASPVGTTYGFRIGWNDPNPTPPDYYIIYQVPAAYPNWDPFSNPAPSSANIRYKTFPGAATNPYSDIQHGMVFFTTPDDGLVLGGSGATVDAEWDIYLVFGHPCFRILNLYGSNLGNGDPNATPDRTQIDTASRGGVDVLGPDWPNWPYPTRYRERVDPTDGTVYWVTEIYVKGPLSEDHKNGRVTMAVNAWGVEEVGDGSGLPLYYAEDCKQHWLENPMLQQWTSGLWADGTTYPKFEDGTPMVRSSAFRRVQDYVTASRGAPLTFGWYIGKQDTLGSFVDELNRTEAFLGINADGQIIDFMLELTADVTDWEPIRHEVDLFGPITHTAGQSRENVINGTCDWDPDFDKFRWPAISTASAAGIARHKGKRQEGRPLNLMTVHDIEQLRWIIETRKFRLQFGLTTEDVEGHQGFLDRDVGTGIKLTTIEGTGEAGYVDRPMVIMRRRYNLSKRPRTVSYTLWDVQNMLPTIALPGGAAQIPIVTTISGSAPMVSDNLSFAPAVLP